MNRLEEVIFFLLLVIGLGLWVAVMCLSGDPDMASTTDTERLDHVEQKLDTSIERLEGEK